MQAALQLLALYVAGGFVPVICARLFAGSDGARRVARAIFLRAPIVLVTDTFWLMLDVLLFFVPRADHALMQDPIMPPKAEPEDTSLRAKLERAKREQMTLIIHLMSGNAHRHEPTLSRAFELGLIDEIAVRSEQVSNSGRHREDEHDNTSEATSVSFVLRAPRVFTDDVLDTEAEGSA